jgi:hypothetical protein
VGGFAETLAVLATWPASTSSWVSVYVAVHDVELCGASVVTGQVAPPTTGSSIATLVSVTLPVFVTMNVYGIVEPLVCPLSAPDCLSSAIRGAAGTSVSMESLAETGLPVGGSAVTDAVFATCPRRRRPGTACRSPYRSSRPSARARSPGS